MIYVGIDIASEKHDYFMIHAETGTVFSSSSVTISNSESGYKKLHEDISAFCGAIGDSNVHIRLAAGSEDGALCGERALSKQRNPARLTVRFRA